MTLKFDLFRIEYFLRFLVCQSGCICEAKTPKIISVAICSRSNDFLTGLFWHNIT